MSFELENINFDLPKHKSNVIKVIGIGGGGSNAVNYMYREGIKGVDFVICNTDRQALENSPVPNKIQLGLNLTEGLGAGANPEIGEQAALESLEELKGLLQQQTKMVFITAGMGGGTGTGAAPIIAGLAKEMGILTVGIVTIPFKFEGNTRYTQAQKGLDKLRESVDSLIVINNNKLREIYGNLGFKSGFGKADEVLATAAKGIAEVITHHYLQNIDLRDAKTVLSNSGTAIMGAAVTAGADRARIAIESALDSPLLNDNKIKGAKNVLLLIVSGTDEITLDEIGEINDHIQSEAGYNADIIMGVGEDESLGDAISVTVIATGFDTDQQDYIVTHQTQRIIHSLDGETKVANESTLGFDTSESIRSIQVNAPELIPPDNEETEEPTRTVFQLEEETFELETSESVEENQLITTSELIRDLSVTAEVVEVIEKNQIDDDFVIIDTSELIKGIEVIDAEVVTPNHSPLEQDDFSFELPLITDENNSEEEAPTVVFDLFSEAEEVVDRVNTNSQSSSVSIEDEMDIVLSTREDLPAATDSSRISQTESNPYEMSLSETEEILAARKEQRIQAFKNFNHQFNKGSIKLDEIERVPAYKRAGVEFDDVPEGSKVSRTTLSEDQNGDNQLRTNNSFLHDNVD
jgi:cell division protein FtsZ